MPTPDGERDHLTQLLTRAAFDAAIREQCRHATEKQPVSLILADIDHFKSVNDNHGHPTGDKVLSEAATRFGLVVQTIIRAMPSDMGGRNSQPSLPITRLTKP